MTFAIITHAEHYLNQGLFYSYGPYIREMNIWLSHVDKGYVVSPAVQKEPGKIDLAYDPQPEKILNVPAISVTNTKEVLKALWFTPFILYRIFMAMYKADHIHLRCPGNIGLLGCIVQIFFPKKPKSAKYAGNWDPGAKQPRSYRFQKWLLANTFLTRNMKVLVYGEWPDQSKNIVPFFTASYLLEKASTQPISKPMDPLRMLFVGGLTPGKRPEYAIEILKLLLDKGVNCLLDVYGDGVKRIQLETMVREFQLEGKVNIHGNVPAVIVEEAYQAAHFLILPSKSEGWPKVVAEAMFWGCIPVVTPISCVPWMVDDGRRGVLLTLDLEQDAMNLVILLSDEARMKSMSKEGRRWSHQYTLDAFENEIVKFVS
ncbi:glycosyltransferase family 4 protein [Aureitalea sp. L0-47]|uniref:glycosyltransferase family 4 protein n=1 Tax=Aureitalea sp. L0-47 TaxID=2816962 RepID=UPI0022388B28|nr:glycosyltransferase family 4 protein [Aureitalea sp. L0-47]MCW5519166.1 glycosyltransferase family 4 protein [Aureitalea sp. L0-47]